MHTSHWRRSTATLPRSSALGFRWRATGARTQPLLSSMTPGGGMGRPSLSVEGASTARVLETYIEKLLVPSLREGQRSW